MYDKIKIIFGTKKQIWQKYEKWINKLKLVEKI